MDAVGAGEVPLEPEAGIVGIERGRVGDVVRHRVGDVRIGVQLGGRLTHRLAVVDLDLLRAAGQAALRLDARELLDRSLLVRRRPLAVLDDHAARHVVGRGCPRRGRQESHGQSGREE